MIEPQNLIEIIHNGLDNLADSDKMSLKYEIKESSTSVSLYIYKKIPSTRQLYILRISDHLPSMQKLVRGDDEPRPSVDENANVSIDFYKPKRIRRVNATTGEVNIKKVPNKFDNYVGVPASIPQVEPFTVSSYEYFYKNLEQGDEMILWHSIASWVCCLSPNKEYHDPFASDEKKRAKTEVKTAEVHVFGDKAEIITENKRYQKMNRINEIGDTPRGQYMLGRLSQSYDEPNIYSDDYDEKPEIASYASDNWHKYGRGDDNENAFNLGKGDEEGVRWIDDGSQRRFRERHGLPPINRQLHKESKHTDMNRINEIGDTPKGQYALGQLAGKYEKMANGTKTGTKAHRKAKGKMWGMRQYANATPHKKGDDFENGRDDYLKKNESKNMNMTLIRLTESDLHRIVKESVNRILKEGRYYNPRTYERGETKEFTHDEIMKLVEILKQNPIEERWKPYDLGFCKVQRVEANNASGTHYLLNPSKTYDPNRPDDSYCDGNNGTIYLQIGRLPNTHWLDDSGYTYMCWKW